MFFKKPITSPNYGDRADGQKPYILLLHYTGMKTGAEALGRLCDPESEVSAHYYMDERGKAINLVPLEKRAWHAGVSYWNGVTDINSASIGIEVVNKGHRFGYTEFTSAQIKALKKLCADIIAEYNILPSHVLAHSDVAPSRKIDPGHLFPWEELAKDRIGLWPAPNEMDYQAAKDIVPEQDRFHELLCTYGYNPQETYENTLVAFHRHYCPGKFSHWDDRPDEADVESVASLLSLIRQKHDAAEAA